MVRKRAIVIFIDWFSPAYLAGGPIQSVVSLTEKLKNQFNVYILTGSTDLDGKQLQGITTDIWTERNGCNVYYCSKAPNYKDCVTLLQNIQFDVAYINSFFSLHYALIPLYALNKKFASIPVVVAPRGMLGLGALQLKKTKKRVFIFAARLFGLFKRVHWHATSQGEKTEILRVFANARKISVIPNISKTISGEGKITKTKNVLRICFVSRISRKKNLLFAMECLNAVEACKIEFEIYGPLEDDIYWKECEALISKMPSNIQVSYKGALDPSQIEAAYSKNHVLFLPTLNENYGHSIVEALLSSRPVIISDQTPWTDLEMAGAGYALSLENKKYFIDAIISYCSMDQQAFDIACKAAKQYIEQKTDANKTTLQYVELFQQA